jgi:hyaluronoglucosaminidase
MSTSRFRRRKARGWIQENPILLNGEPGYETDTGRVKVGDGSSRWTELDYVGAYMLAAMAAGEQPPSDSSLLNHIQDPTPHAVYDDGPSLALLYKNAKV